MNEEAHPLQVITTLLCTVFSMITVAGGRWCIITSTINQSKLQALWYNLNNKAVGQAMPAVSFNGEVIKCTNSLRYLRVHFDRMLTYKTQARHKVEQVKAHLSAMQNPNNELHNAVKEERGVDWQEASHGWAKQNNQSSMCGLTELKQVRDWEKRPVEFKPC